MAVIGTFGAFGAIQNLKTLFESLKTTLTNPRQLFVQVSQLKHRRKDKKSVRGQNMS